MSTIWHSETMRANEVTLREKMKELLARCTPAEQDVFRRMYDHRNQHANPVDGVKIENLDWAFAQIERTLGKHSSGASKLRPEVPHDET